MSRACISKLVRVLVHSRLAQPVRASKTLCLCGRHIHTCACFLCDIDIIVKYDSAVEMAQRSLIIPLDEVVWTILHSSAVAETFDDRRVVLYAGS